MTKSTAISHLPLEEVPAFMLGRGEFGIDVQCVQGIRGLAAIAQEANEDIRPC